MRKTLLKKSLVCGIIALLVGISIVPIAESSFPNGPKERYCYPRLEGNIGNHGWYISPVNVRFVYDPDVVETIFYKINTGQWIQYTGPFRINHDGYYRLEWYFIDFSGEQHKPNATSIKIDMTPPMVTWYKQVVIIENRIVYTACPTDNMSGIDCVEFYLNGVLQKNIAAPGPYVWVLHPIPRHGWVGIRTYDVAGNNMDGPYVSSQQISQIQSQNRPISQQINQLLLHLIMHHPLIGK